MLILISILFPMAAGPAVSLKKGLTDEQRNRAWRIVVIASDLLALLGALFGRPFTLMSFTDSASLSFFYDPLGRYALAAVLLLYTAVCFYAFEYMKMEEEPGVFFAFFFISMGALIGVCASENLVTLYLSFELATLSSMPLVLHERTKEAVTAALKYLFYSIAGALMGLLGVFFIYQYSRGSRFFQMGGFLDPSKVGGHEGLLLAVIFVAILGFGTKAGMYPMHGWLPAAHPIAPAPASSLLSGIIAKAGVIAIIRLVYFCVGTEFLSGTWVQTAWICLCLLTIFMGSMMAFQEKDLKKRLAYSTVSQISYILLSLSQLSPQGLQGGLIHMFGHVCAKGCLFLCAGAFIYRLHKRDVRTFKGVGKVMPVTMACFLTASLSLIGIPPLAGFLSKWVIAGAALSNGLGVLSYLPPIILIISALLTAGYTLPLAVDAFFPGRDFDASALSRDEVSPLMTVPMICLCVGTLIIGLFGTGLSALVLR